MIGTWLKMARRLRERGILGMNQRNAECILDRNPRALFPIVDDKQKMRDLCLRIGVPTPEVWGVFRSPGELRNLEEKLAEIPEMVVKPARGSSGRGIMVLTGRKESGFLRPSGKMVTWLDLRQHLGDILSGLYSLGGQPDQAILQQRIHIHPAFRRISYNGIPDIRVLVYRNRAILAMLRLPTLESEGRANLHQGGIGVGVDMTSGRTFRAIWRNQRIDRHPDTAEFLADREIPHWPQVVEMSQKVSRAIGLGFVGIDIVLDDQQGPMLLEANARPGLAIQLANGVGLRPLLEAVDLELDHGKLAPR